jgi:hypothetical protein
MSLDDPALAKEDSMARMRQLCVVTTAVGAVLCGCLLLWAQGQPQAAQPPVEQERKVQEAEVPAAALAQLKKLAGAAPITQFSEEVEHGHKYYEGSWKGPDGNVDALVTEAGDVVEIEEVIPAAKVPAAVRAVIEKEAGKDAAVQYEKKTYVAYEAHFKKDGKGREILLTPEGRTHSEEGDDGDEDEDD